MKSSSSRINITQEHSCLSSAKTLTPPLVNSHLRNRSLCLALFSSSFQQAKAAPYPSTYSNELLYARSFGEFDIHMNRCSVSLSRTSLSLFLLLLWSTAVESGRRERLLGTTALQTFDYIRVALLMNRTEEKKMTMGCVCVDDDDDDDRYFLST